MKPKPPSFLQQILRQSLPRWLQGKKPTLHTFKNGGMVPQQGQKPLMD
jgi:hypothetical protein